MSSTNKKRLLRHGKKAYDRYRAHGLKGLLNMGTKKIRTVMVGCGQYATQNIYPALRHCPIELAATSALHKEHAERNAQWFGAAHSYDDYLKMLDAEKPDAAIIVVNASAHAEMACEALKRGINVFIAKPPGVDPEDAGKIAEAARKSGKIAMVDFQKRYAPACVKAKELMRTKGFGAPRHIQMKLCTGRTVSGEDFILDIGIHHLDLARFFFGEVASLTLAASRNGPGEAYAITLEFENGAVGSLIQSEQQSWFHHNERIEITGSGSSLEIDNVCTLTYFDKGLEILGLPVGQLLGQDRGRVVWEPNFTCMTAENSLLYQAGVVGSLQHFCDCVLTGNAPQSSIEDACKTMLLVAQAKKLAKK